MSLCVLLCHCVIGCVPVQSAQLREANSRLLRRALDAERRVRRADEKNQELMKTIAELNGETSTSGPHGAGSRQRERDSTQGEEREPKPRVGDSEAGSRENVKESGAEGDGVAGEGGPQAVDGVPLVGISGDAPDVAVAGHGEAEQDGLMKGSTMNQFDGEGDEEGAKGSEGERTGREYAPGALGNRADEEEEEEECLDGDNGSKKSIDSSQSYSGELLA